jgi:hypothetical protein
MAGRYVTLGGEMRTIKVEFIDEKGDVVGVIQRTFNPHIYTDAEVLDEIARIEAR